MKIIGITRRIDELGRIVIPKEIRNNMHIKSGDLLEIYLQDENTLSLKKYNILKNCRDILKEYLIFLGKKINLNIFLTDMDKIIFSNILDEKNNVLIPNLSNDYKQFDELKLTDKYTLKQPFSIYKLSPNGDLIGYVIFEYNTEQKNKELVDFAVEFIRKYLETE